MLEALRGVLEVLVEQVREHDVDVVVVAGDVFDSSMPAAECFSVLTDTLRAIRDAGAKVVVTSGNHDSAARLGFQAPLLADGVHILTDPRAVGTPVTIDGVHFYGIPYLEPALVRHLWPDETLRTQQQVIAHAMRLINDDRASRGGVSVAIAHCFAAGVEATPQLEREVRQNLTQGSLDVVPLADLAGPDYVALGHIHGRSTLAEHIRYSGAPLHYSFGEAHKPRGSWLVELSENGFESATWLDLPIPRGHATLTGTLDEIIAMPATTTNGSARFSPTNCRRKIRCASFENATRIARRLSTGPNAKKARRKAIANGWGAAHRIRRLSTGSSAMCAKGKPPQMRNASSSPTSFQKPVRRNSHENRKPRN